MRAQPVAASQNRRIVAGLPFVEALARRMAASMPNSIDIGDLVQDGVLGLIDAAHRFDEARGIKFETFAERRVRGAMIDALRRDAWPRGVRRQRRELDAAREALRRELGHEPSMADLAARVGSDEKRLSRTIVRINTIESTSPLATGEHIDESSLPAALVPSEPDSPDAAYEKAETRSRVRGAIQSLPWRERKVVGLYYYGEVTMKQIGAEIGVNESRVSQLHARAIRRLRDALGDMNPQKAAELKLQLIAFATAKPAMAKARMAPPVVAEKTALPPAVVIPYKPVQVGKASVPTRAVMKSVLKTAMKPGIKAAMKAPMKSVRVRQPIAAAR
ncbi:MAG TPA: FliA/WhiG family RNA polymerase sigma factor [Vicinamibacterales bacterium]|nr:FliA/WhiG family RNA polymerase sigma factor [Vicinamibacterales bacterium]